METSTRYTRSGEVNLAYQVVGDGPVDLVVIPGWVSNLEEGWQTPELAAWLRSLGQFSRLIVFDKRGTGLSDRVDERNLPDLEQRMSDVLAILDAAGSRRAAVLGMSEGGPLAIRFAVEHAERVSHLILYAAYARWLRDDDYPWGLTAAQHEKTIGFLTAHWGAPVGLELMAPSVAADPAAQQRWASLLRRGASPGTAAALYRMNCAIDVRADLARVTAPTLVLHRRDDRLIEVGHGRFLRDRIPGAQYLELAGNDHLPWYGDAGAVLLPIQTFLADQAVPAPGKAALSPADVTTLYLVRDYLETALGQEHTLERLSRRFGLNEFKLKTSFKQLFGVPVIAYLNELRLEQAHVRLLHGREPVQEIAETLGYRHANNFSSAFKRRYGISPQQVRRNGDGSANTVK
jgi:pimeloyl-ACP methyl ester carboxylesterase/AraC-like DNA-binding protein